MVRRGRNEKDAKRSREFGKASGGWRGMKRRCLVKNREEEKKGISATDWKQNCEYTATITWELYVNKINVMLLEKDVVGLIGQVRD